MAKKRKHHTTHRRRRVGAAGMTSVLPAIGTAIAGNIIGKIIASKFTSLSPKILGAVLVGGGAFAATNKSPLIKGLGIGLATAGGQVLGQSFGLISGIGAAGLRDAVPLIGGAAEYPVIGDVYGDRQLEGKILNGVYDDYSS
jgi:hypothetical protein